jgi:hypothetical protein
MDIKFIKFLADLENNQNSHLIESIGMGYSYIFEANGKVENILMQIAEEFDLPAKDWDDYIKKEIIHSKRYEDLINKSKGKIKSNKDLFKLVLEALSINFRKPQIIEVDITDFTQENGIFSGRGKSHQAHLIDNIMISNQNHSEDPDNIARHAKQKELLEKSGGINEEPVILLDRDGKYELIEGFHRVVQMLIANNNGRDKFKLNAYIGKYEEIPEKAKKILEKPSILKVIVNRLFK